MNILSENFELERYGVKVRLAPEQDAFFILSLRTDERLSRFLHKTDNDLVKQLEWMKAYKEREHKGEDYYFIYTNDDGPFGLNRIYDIHDDCGTGGSWLCKPDTDVEASIATLLIMRDIMFDCIGLQNDLFDVRKGNSHVQKIHKMMGAKMIGETDLDYLFKLSKSDYQVSKEKILQLLNLKE